MANVGNLPINLLAVILLVVPGLLGVELYYKFSKKKSSLSRIQWVGYGAGVSLLSIYILYLTTPLYFVGLNEFLTDVANSTGFITSNELSDLAIPSLVVLYVVHVVLAGLLGVLVGSGEDRLLHMDDEMDPRESWKYAFDESSSDEEEVEVVLSDGNVIRGKFNEAAWDRENRELFLDDPYEVVYSKQRNEIKREIDLGRGIFLQTQGISHILFVKEDPDSGKAETISEADLENVKVPELIEEILKEGYTQPELKEFDSADEEFEHSEATEPDDETIDLLKRYGYISDTGDEPEDD